MKPWILVSSSCLYEQMELTLHDTRVGFLCLLTNCQCYLDENNKSPALNFNWGQIKRKKKCQVLFSSMVWRFIQGTQKLFISTGRDSCLNGFSCLGLQNIRSSEPAVCLAILITHKLLFVEGGREIASRNAPQHPLRPVFLVYVYRDAHGQAIDLCLEESSVW